MSVARSKLATHGSHTWLADEGKWGLFATGDALSSSIGPRLSSASWKSGVSGNWNTAADWSAGTVPNSTTDATIAATGRYTVTINTADAAHSLTINDSTGTVDDTGTLTVGTTLAVTAGTFILDSGGTVNGGTISTGTGGKLLAQGGTLSGVTYRGSLDLSPAGANLTIANGIMLQGAGGTGAGTINLTGNSAALFTEDSTTLNNATLNFGGAGYDTIYLYPVLSNTDTLTLGSTLNLIQSAAGSVDTIDLYEYPTSGYLINQGTISAAATGGTFTVFNAGGQQTSGFTNTGTVIVSNGDYFNVEAVTRVSNQGTFMVLGGGTLDLSTVGTLTNNGTLTATGAGTVVDLSNLTNTGGLSVANGATFNLGGTFTSAGLNSIANSGGTIAIVGNLLNAGAVFSPSGSLILEPGGIISGGTVVGTGFFVASGGTLNGVTFQAPLNLTTANSSLFLSGTDIFAGTGGTGAGTINLTGNSAALFTEDSTTLNNATLNFGGAGYDTIYLYPVLSNTDTLTLGSTLNLIQSAAGSVDTIDLYLYPTSGYLINQGTISAAATGGTFTVFNAGGQQTSGFTNTGTVIVSNGDYFNVETVTSVFNQGTFMVLGGGTLDLSTVGTLTNNGTLTATGAGTVVDLSNLTNTGGLSVANGATFNLGGTFTSAGLNSIANSGGTIAIVGNLLNAGAVFSPSGSLILEPGGIISGGTVVGTGFFVASGGTLNGVTFQAPLNLTTANSSLFLSGTDIFAGTGGTGAGTINLTGNSAALFTEDSTTLNNATLNFGGAGYDTIYLYPVLSNTDTLTLGSTLNLIQSAAGSVDTIDLYEYPTSGYLINQGTISAAATGGTFTVFNAGGQQTSGFTNIGTVIVSNDDYFNVEAVTSVFNQGTFMVLGGGTLDLSTVGTLTNLHLSTLTGGQYEVDAGSTFLLLNNASIATDAATVILSGANTVLESYNTSSGKYVTIDQKLTTIAAAGTLELLAGRGLSSANAFTDSGLLQLGGATFSETSLTIGAGGRISGFGTITPAVADGGTIEAKGGTLLVSGAVTGAGTLQIDAGATLQLHSSTTSAETATFAGQGTLKLDAASSFASPIANYQGGDVLNIGTLVATAAAISGSTLAITLSGGGSLSENLTGSFANERTGISADGHSITAYREAMANALAPAALGNVHVGGTASTTLSLTNTDPADGYSEKLDATISASGSGITASGSVSLLAAGATDSSDLRITAMTSHDGAISGSATIALSTDGTGIDGQSAIGIGSQTIAVTGAAYNYASGTLASSMLAFGNHHVGDSAIMAVTLTNGAPADGYSEALDASFAPGATGVSASGAITGLAAGASNATTLQLALNTATAGAVSGGATLSLASDGTGIDGLGTTALAGQAIGASGAVFAFAAGTLASSTINLGIHHVGDVVSQALTLTNSGPVTGGYTEGLDATLGGATTGITASGSVNLLGVGASNSTALLLGLNTGKVGVVSGTATLGLSSDGTGLDGLGTTGLAGQTVTVTGTIDNYAKLQLFQVVGTTGVGIANHATVNLGTTTVGAKALSVTLGVDNYVAGPSDVLGGSFTETGTGFTNKGFNPFSNLGSMQYEHNQSVTLATTTAGVFTETIQVSGTGSNASGYSGALATQTITVTGTIAAAGAAIAAPDAAPSGAISFLLGTQPTGTALPLGTADLAATPAPSEFVPALSSTTTPPSATASVWVPTTPVFADHLDSGLSAAHPPAPDYVSHLSAIV